MTSAVANPLDKINANWVSPVAQIMDIFPFFGTVKNVIDLFLRYCWKPENLENLSPIVRAYHKVLHEKTLLETILYLVPFVGIVVKLIIVAVGKNPYAHPLNRLKGHLQDFQEIRTDLQEIREDVDRVGQDLREQRQMLQEYQTDLQKADEALRRNVNRALRVEEDRRRLDRALLKA